MRARVLPEPDHAARRPIWRHSHVGAPITHTLPTCAHSVHKAVVASGARFTGPTIHFIDEGYDTGPILAQAVVRVSPTDTPEQVAANVLVQVRVTEFHFQ